jgi:hypothetical protein
LFEPWRSASGKLPDDGVSDDGPDGRSDTTSSTAAARDFGLFTAARTPHLSLRVVKTFGSAWLALHRGFERGAETLQLLSRGKFCN